MQSIKLAKENIHFLHFTYKKFTNNKLQIINKWPKTGKYIRWQVKRDFFVFFFNILGRIGSKSPSCLTISISERWRRDFNSQEAKLKNRIEKKN
jgi:hypothetical protein